MDAEQGYASHVLSRIALNAGGAAKSTLDSPLRRTRARHCRGAPSRHSPWRKPGARRGLGDGLLAFLAEEGNAFKAGGGNPVPAGAQDFGPSGGSGGHPAGLAGLGGGAVGLLITTGGLPVGLAGGRLLGCCGGRLLAWGRSGWAGRAGAGALAGLPIAVKDLFDTCDMPTGYGSPIYAGYQPRIDAAVVALIRRTRQAGVDIHSTCGNHDLRLYNAMLRHRRGIGTDRLSRVERRTIERLGDEARRQDAFELLTEKYAPPECGADGEKGDSKPGLS